MPVLVAHPDHVDCEVCAHSAIAGLGHTVPKSQEEHDRTCCSPAAKEGRQHLEDQAAAAIEADRVAREEEAKRQREVEARYAEQAATGEQAALKRDQPEAWARAMEDQRLRRLEAQIKPVRLSRLRRFVAELAWQVRRDRQRINRRLHPVPEYWPGTNEAAWFGDDDPTVADLFAQAETHVPSRWDRLRAKFRR